MTKREQHLLQIARSDRTILGAPKPQGYIWAIAHSCRKPLQTGLAAELHGLYLAGKLELERILGWRDSPAHDHVYVYRLPKAPSGLIPRGVPAAVVRPAPLCA